MKIKEVSAGVKISRNYDSYSVNLIADVEDNENYEKVGDNLIDKSLEILNNKINDKKFGGNEKEVGAAWYSKESPEKLSVQSLKGGGFSEIEVKYLENKGSQQVVGDDTFVFRRIPLEKRKNNKMSLFGIYLEGKNE